MWKQTYTVQAPIVLLKLTKVKYCCSAQEQGGVSLLQCLTVLTPCHSFPVTLINLWQNEVKGAHYIQICGHLIRPMCHINFLLLNLHPFYRLLSYGCSRDWVWRTALLGQKGDKELQRTQTFPTVSLHDTGCVLSVIRLHWFRRSFAWLHLSLPGCGELINASGDHKCQSLSSMLRTVGFLSWVNGARLRSWPITHFVQGLERWYRIG